MPDHLAHEQNLRLSQKLLDQQGQIKELTVDAERFKQDHLGACGTIAEMHAAATGRTGMGPVRGVVEDVADVRARGLAAEEALANALRAVAELAEAIRLTREYVGEELLPPVEGWSWYDALLRHAPSQLPASARPKE